MMILNLMLVKIIEMKNNVLQNNDMNLEYIKQINLFQYE